MTGPMIHVCTDCLFAHHYGTKRYAIGTDGEPWGPFSDEEAAQMPNTTWVWTAGESDTITELEPLALVADVELWDADDTDEFSWSSCDGCGSRLGGARHAFAITSIREEP